MLEALFLLAAPLGAPPPPALVIEVRDDEATAQAAVDAILDDYEAKRREFFEAYQKAETDDERGKLFEELYPQAEEFVPRLWETVEAYPLTEAAASALAWIAQNDEGGKDRERAVATLLADHIERESIGEICGMFADRFPDGEATLERVLAESPHRSVQGRALFHLAKWHMGAADYARTLSTADEETRQSYAGYLGEDTVAWIATVDQDAFRKEAEGQLERVAEEFGDVESYRGTLGDQANGVLFEIRHLQIGMVAPDIEGVDLDGAAFKLSDYRGKVVVLDFWGDW